MSERPEGTPEETPVDPVAPEPTPEIDSDAVAVDELLAVSGLDPEPEPEFEPEPEWEPVTEAEGDGEGDLESEPGDALPDDATPAEVAAAAAVSSRRRRGTPAPTGPRVPTPSERAVRVTDTPSKAFVIASVAIFVLILFYGLVAGHGGLLTTKPTPNPSASASPAVSSSAEPSSSAAPSGSPAASGSATPSTSAVPSVAVSPSPS